MSRQNAPSVLGLNPKSKRDEDLYRGIVHAWYRRKYLPALHEKQDKAPVNPQFRGKRSLNYDTPDLGVPIPPELPRPKTKQVYPGQRGDAGTVLVADASGAIPHPSGTIYDERDIDAVTRTMLGEAAGEGDEGLAAVAHVLLNRQDAGKYGGSLYDIAHAPKQFSAWNSKGNGGNGLVDVSADDPRYQEARQIAEQVLNGQHEDNTGGATNYFAPKGMTGKNGTKKGDPDWASQMSYTTTIGGHKFYSDDSAAGAAEKMGKGGKRAIDPATQDALRRAGFDPGASDGINGPRTTAAIKAFQQARGLVPDGIVGPKTTAALQGGNRPHTQPQPLVGARQPANILAPPPLIQPEDIRDAFFDPLPAPKPLVAPNGGLITRKVATVPIDPDGNPVLGATPQATGRTLGSRAAPAPMPGRPSSLDDPVDPATLGNLGLGNGPGFGPHWGTLNNLKDLAAGKYDEPSLASPAPIEAPQAPAAPGGFGNVLGGLAGMIPGGSLLTTAINNTELGKTLGGKVEEAGKTLGNTATQAKTAIETAAPGVAEKLARDAAMKLMSTVEGRTLALNTAMGITPAKRAEERVADRAASAPKGFAYGATGKKLYKIGQTYNSSRGQVVFDGQRFVPAGTQVRSSVDIPRVNGVQPAGSSRPRESFDQVWNEAKGYM